MLAMPPTALPTRLRLFVDPPPPDVPAHQGAPAPVGPARRRRLRSVAARLLPGPAAPPRHPSRGR